MDCVLSVESRFQKDRWFLIAALAILSALAWGYTVYLAKAMNCSAMCLLSSRGGIWRASEFVVMLVMWTVMMAAMMIPSASPMVMVFARVNHKRRQQQRPFVPTGFFLLGYLVVWAGFSAVATWLQGWLHAKALLSPEMMISNSVASGVILLAAGIFQWTPFKNACLVHCRTPLNFIMTSWREGNGGALMMGIHHGMHCLGCCWLLMVLLFVGGVMNIAWITILTLFVLAEKVVPYGRWVSRIGGVALGIAGVMLIGKGI